jgi:hypothetical protein
MKIDMKKGIEIYQQVTQQLVGRIAAEQKKQNTPEIDPVFAAHGLAMELAKFLEGLLPNAHMYEGVVLMVNAIGSALLHLGQIRDDQKEAVKIPPTEEMVEEICHLFCAGLSVGMQVADEIKKKEKEEKKLIIH